jgi:hypothetical protein
VCIPQAPQLPTKIIGNFPLIKYVLNVYKQMCTTTEATFVNNKPVKVGGYFGNAWSTLGEILNFR